MYIAMTYGNSITTVRELICTEKSISDIVQAYETQTDEAEDGRLERSVMMNK